MSSHAQRAANRRNAQKSTGPRTPQGRATSAFNSVTHGFFSHNVLLLPGEDPVELEWLTREFLREHPPVGMLERLFADKIIADAWRIKRLHRLEVGLFSRGFPQFVELDGFHEIEAIFCRLTSMSDEQLAGARIDEPEEGADPAAAEHLALAFVENTGRDDLMSKFTRYEAALQRTLIQDLHEFQRLQASRAGLLASPPAAVDITIHGDASQGAV